MAEIKHKRFSRKRKLKATNISDPLIHEVFEANSIAEMSRYICISSYKLRKLIESDLEEDYIRSQVTGKLWEISYEFDYVVKAIPKYQDAELLDTVHEFTSAYKCCKFLGISKDTYYKRLKEQPIGQPCKRFVKDVFDREWQLIFLKEPKPGTFEEVRFKQNENL